MARISNTELGVAYPKLTADQLDLIIAALSMMHREAYESPAANEVTDLIGHLIGFYTRRWGLPPCLVKH